MTIPLSSLSASIDKTLRSIHLELWERIQNRGWSTHQGIPTPDRLPKETIQVWMAPTNMTDDLENATLNSESFVSYWAIHIIRMETAPGKTDVDYLELYYDLGKVIESVSNTVSNAGLDGAVDWVVPTPIQFFSADPATAGDANYIGALLTVEAHHSLQPIRCE